MKSNFVIIIRAFATILSISLVIYLVIMMIITNFIEKDNLLEEYPSGLIKDQINNSSVTSEFEFNVSNVGLNKEDVAPDFELVNLKGEKVKLSDYKGKTILLNFWASWCPPCVEEMPILQKYYEEHADVSDIEIVAVNMTRVERGNIEKVEEFAKEFEITFQILLDNNDGKIMDLYEVLAFPTTYIINKEGIITDKIISPLDYKKIEELINNSK